MDMKSKAKEFNNLLLKSPLFFSDKLLSTAAPHQFFFQGRVGATLQPSLPLLF